MRIKLAVIADDLTGANDTGVQYAKKGLETVVLTDLESIEQIKEKVDVIVIDTESRAESAETAYSKVRKTAEVIRKIGVKIIYKKIDSTLRGNIGAEYDAIMDVLKIDIGILVPAFPANGRITVGGYQLLNQVPLGLTEISKDPLTPVKESHVPTLLSGQTKREIFHITLSNIFDPDNLVDALNRVKNEKKGIIILDAVTQRDLKTIAKALLKTNLEKLTGGPAGLAEEMPEALGLVKGKSAILISGSVSEITLRQVKKAEKESGVQVIKLNVQKILKSSKLKKEEIDRVLKEVRDNLAEGNDSIITSAISKSSVEKDIEFGRKNGLSNIETSKEIASTLGQITSKVAMENISGIVITGGSIAINALKVMKALGFRVLDEVLPGIPISQIMGGEFAGLRVVTKAGAFGDEDALAICMKQLKRRI
ncbi:MAG: four-carbon acid sugar kinase family protein [Candidatus Bathyarchaeota archaeon]|nr:four-carbon acid sugar kinase family protein [Candidatus Bathyarchaeota archaeon]